MLNIALRKGLLDKLPPEEIAIIQSATEGQTIPTPTSPFRKLSEKFECNSDVKANNINALSLLTLTITTSCLSAIFMKANMDETSPFAIAASLMFSGLTFLSGPARATLYQRKRNRDIQGLADAYNKDQETLYKELCLDANIDAQSNYVAALKAKLDSGAKLTLPELAKLVNVKDFILFDHMMIQSEYNALAITVLQAKMALAQYRKEVEPFEIVNSTDADLDISNATQRDYLATDLWQQARAMDEIIRITANQNAQAATAKPKPDGTSKEQSPRTTPEIFAEKAKDIKGLTATKVLKAPFKLAVGLLDYYADGILAIRDAAIPRQAADYLAPFPTEIRVPAIPVAEDLGAALRYYQDEGTPPLDLPALARG